jgi:hypothetical protein
MDIMNVDMAKIKDALDEWRAGNLANGNYAPFSDSSLGIEEGTMLYITDTGAEPDYSSGNSNKGVRFHNGAQMPKGGITLATDLLAYVMGDFNTGGTRRNVDTNDGTSNLPHPDDKPYDPSLSYRPADYPTALMADSIRLLSSRWNDEDSTKNTGRRDARNTTFNLAMVMGHRSTNDTQTDTGGLHNFPRFLEDWNGREATIRGAFVQLWQSAYNTAAYHCCPAYNPPKRHWGFQQSFEYRAPIGVELNADHTPGRYWVNAGGN